MAFDPISAALVPGAHPGPDSRRAAINAEVSFELLYEEALLMPEESPAGTGFADSVTSSDCDLFSRCASLLPALEPGLREGEDRGSEPAMRVPALPGYRCEHELLPTATNSGSSSTLAGESRIEPKRSSRNGQRGDCGTPVSQISPSAPSGLKKRLADWMDAHALRHSTHRCAMFFRRAMEAAGIHSCDRPSSGDAADYGPFLLKHGAHEISPHSYRPEVGDTVVFERSPEHPAGHIEVFDGERWVSDFTQNGFSPYRTSGTPPYKIYRLS